MREFFKKPKATRRPATWIFLKTTAYGYADRAIVNHDTASSPGIIVHVQKNSDGTSRIVPGHAFDS
ncbi:MAG: hypothetical protein P1U81_15080 [Verrucomicrobiales bacterium]|jgi:hypothetical protein|nr:hypothetical protein [Verrucomicrobiales bacterium]